MGIRRASAQESFGEQLEAHCSIPDLLRVLETAEDKAYVSWDRMRQAEEWIAVADANGGDTSLAEQEYKRAYDLWMQDEDDVNVIDIGLTVCRESIRLS